MYISKFVCGFIVGALLGVTALCVIALIVAKNDDKEDKEDK